MNREEVMSKVKEHLSAELEVDAAEIAETTRFREDLDADSLDLYELVMELEDSYGVRVPEEDAAEIETVGQAVDFVLARLPTASSVAAIAPLLPAPCVLVSHAGSLAVSTTVLTDATTAIPPSGCVVIRPSGGRDRPVRH